MVFKGTTGVYERIYRFNSKCVRNKEKYANSQWIFFFCLKARSENGYGFYRSSLKMGVENSIFRSEIGSGFGESGGTPLPRIPRGDPPGYYPPRTLVGKLGEEISS